MAIISYKWRKYYHTVHLGVVKVGVFTCSLCEIGILLQIIELLIYCFENWTVYQYGSWELWIKCFM